MVHWQSLSVQWKYPWQRGIRRHYSDVHSPIGRSSIWIAWRSVIESATFDHRRVGHSLTAILPQTWRYWWRDRDSVAGTCVTARGPPTLVGQWDSLWSPDNNRPDTGRPIRHGESCHPGHCDRRGPSPWGRPRSTYTPSWRCRQSTERTEISCLANIYFDQSHSTDNIICNRPMSTNEIGGFNIVVASIIYYNIII